MQINNYIYNTLCNWNISEETPSQVFLLASPILGIFFRLIASHSENKAQLEIDLLKQRQKDLLKDLKQNESACRILHEQAKGHNSTSLLAHNRLANKLVTEKKQPQENPESTHPLQAQTSDDSYVTVTSQPIVSNLKTELSFINQSVVNTEPEISELTLKINALKEQADEFKKLAQNINDKMTSLTKCLNRRTNYLYASILSTFIITAIAYRSLAAAAIVGATSALALTYGFTYHNPKYTQI